MEQQNYTVIVPLQSVVKTDYTVNVALQEVLQVEYKKNSKLATLSILGDAINPDTLKLADFSFAERITYADLKDLDVTNIICINVDFYRLDDISVNSKLKGYQDGKYAIEKLADEDWDTTFKRIKETYNKQEDWQKRNVTILSEWLSKNWADNIDKWNESVKTGTTDVLKFINALSSYTGANQKPGTSLGAVASTLVSKAMTGFTDAVSDLSDAFSMSNSELAAKLRGTGAGLLRGSILSEDYLNLVSKNPGIEPVSLKGMSFLKGQKSGEDNYGPTMLPFKMKSGGIYLKLVKEVKVDHGDRIDFDKVLVRKMSKKPDEQDYTVQTYDKQGIVTESSPWKDVSKVNDEVAKNEANTESAILTQDMLDKGEAISDPVLSSNATKNFAADPTKISEEHHIQPESIEIEANAEKYHAAKEVLTEQFTQELSKNSKYVPSSNQYPDPSKHHYEDNPLDLLHTIITSLDAQMQRFIAYFTTIDNDNEEHFLKMETPDNASEYFYFFYSNGFTCNPAKKTMTDLKYGAFKTSVALERPDVNNTFNFSLPTDLQASFWKFVMQNGLGVNLESNVYSNADFFTDNIRGINLNFVLLQSNRDSGVITKDTARVNKFVLENIYFSNIDALKFQQDFGSSPVKSGIKGIYKRLMWYHNSPLEPAKN